MAEHLAGGGLILAAVHDPLPIAARTVEIGGVSGSGVLLPPRAGAGLGRRRRAAAGAGLLRRRRRRLLPLALGPRRRGWRRSPPGVAWVALALATPALAGAAVRARLRGRRAGPAGARARCRWRPSRAVKCLAQWTGHRRAAGAGRAGRRHRAGRAARAGAADLRRRGCSAASPSPSSAGSARRWRLASRRGGAADRGDRPAADHPAGDLRRRGHRRLRRRPATGARPCCLLAAYALAAVAL